MHRVVVVEDTCQCATNGKRSFLQPTTWRSATGVAIGTGTDLAIFALLLYAETMSTSNPASSTVWREKPQDGRTALETVGQIRLVGSYDIAPPSCCTKLYYCCYGFSVSAHTLRPPPAKARPPGLSLGM